MNFEAQIFIPSGKKKRDIGTIIIYVSLGIEIFIGAFLSLFKVDDTVHHVLNVCIGIFCFIAVMIISSNSFRFEPLNGEIKGSLKLDDTTISFGERVIKWDDIIDFDFNKYFDLPSIDYYGLASYRGMSPALSQGIENEIHIKTKQGDSIIIYFRFDDRQHWQQLKPFVRMLVIKNKISFLRAIGLLKLNYEEVQELKKQMGEEG